MFFGTNIFLCSPTTEILHIHLKQVQKMLRQFHERHRFVIGFKNRFRRQTLKYCLEHEPETAQTDDSKYGYVDLFSRNETFASSWNRVCFVSFRIEHTRRFRNYNTILRNKNQLKSLNLFKTCDVLLKLWEFATIHFRDPHKIVHANVSIVLSTMRKRVWLLKWLTGLIYCVWNFI